MSYDQHYEIYQKEIIKSEIETLKNKIKNDKAGLVLFQKKIKKYENEKYSTLEMKKTYVSEVNKIRKLEEILYELENKVKDLLKFRDNLEKLWRWNK